jgi:methionyl aminopeptidase
MTVTTEEELAGLRAIGRIVANTLATMGRALEPGMTTQDLDSLGRDLLDRAGAVSAPQAAYAFPGTTCISLNEEIAHGIPGPRVIGPGDLVNIDVSASKDGFFADTGASFVVPPARPALSRLCRDGRRAMQIGIAEVGADRPLGGIGRAIGRFAERRGYTLIRNLCSHGTGRALHEDPAEVATWPVRGERRVLRQGQVLTVEPFLSLGGLWADSGTDGWTLHSRPAAPVVQYEHTVMATRSGPVVLTLPG